MVKGTKKFNGKMYSLASAEYGQPKKDIEFLKESYLKENYSVRTFNPHRKSSPYYNSSEYYLYVIPGKKSNK